MFKFVSILCCINLFVICVYGQEGSSCYTSRKEFGSCINLKTCNYMIQLLINHKQDPEILNYLRSSTCGFVGKDPLICCPQKKEEEESEENLIVSGGNQNEKLPVKPQCGLSNVTNPRIVGGAPAKLNEFPFMAILGYRNKLNPTIPKWLCGGTLITEKHVLTAAHCAYNRNDLYLVRVGELILYDDMDSASPEDISISKIKMHESFSPTEFTNDIAIITLSKKPKNPLVWPVCLPIEDRMRSSSYIGENGVVAGWGSLYFDGPRSSSLQVADMPILNENSCQRVFGQNTVIDNRIICAGWLSGGKDTCQGDSGGPLMFAVKEQKHYWYYQIGIISYGFRCAEIGYPGVFTRVTNYLDWIQTNVV
ncbi:venom protease-like [Diabrotica undecimpunctata]|uniref:venom protease-like n=1 Tax=Diabrotica undecimpunctata TaxID=50387 RepID=UPI003B63E635